MVQTWTITISNDQLIGEVSHDAMRRAVISAICEGNQEAATYGPALAGVEIDIKIKEQR